MSSKITPAFVARQAGYKSLSAADQTHFKTLPAFSDGSPVGLVLRIFRSRMPGQFVYSITTDGGETAVAGSGGLAEIEGSEFVALFQHEVYELRKEASS